MPAPNASSPRLPVHTLPIREDSLASEAAVKPAVPVGTSGAVRPRSKSDAVALRVAEPSYDEHTDVAYIGGMASGAVAPSVSNAAASFGQTYGAYGAQQHLQTLHASHGTHVAHSPPFTDLVSPTWAYASTSGMPGYEPAVHHLDYSYYSSGRNMAQSEAAPANHALQYSQPYAYGGYPQYQPHPHLHDEAQRYAMEYAAMYGHPLPSPSYYSHPHGGYFPMPPAGGEQQYLDHGVAAAQAYLQPTPPATGAAASSAAASTAAAATGEPLLSAPTLPGVPERNQLHLGRIADGQDTRTTVMIKNIPNKMTDQDLLAFIADVVPRRIDFCYLRMDFANGAL